MEFFKIISAVAQSIIAVLIAGMLIATMAMPEQFGQWLQQIDNGRYGGGCYEYDYTEEL